MATVYRYSGKASPGGDARPPAAGRWARRRFSRPTGAAAERVAEIEQSALEACGEIEQDLEEAGVETAQWPSEGVVLVARRLAIAGRSNDEIARLLAQLGVEDAPEGVARALGDGPS